MFLNKIFHSQTNSVALAAFFLGVSSLASRLLGLVRDRLLAGRFGAGEELDIYFAAFRIPDFVYGLLIMGGISAVFLPVFSEVFHKDKEESWKLANNTLSVFLFLMAALCAVLFLFAPQLVSWLVPGFSEENQKLTSTLTRIMFLSPILFGISSVFSGVLQYFNRFLVYSLAPIFYNVGIIIGILYFVPLWGLTGLAWGVILGALLYLVIQLPPAFISGYHYQPVFNLKSAPLIKILKLAVPRIIATGTYNINLAVITSIASTLSAGSIAIFNFSNNLQYLPVGIIGISFAMASFPQLTIAWAEGDRVKFLDNFSSVFRQTLFLIIPTSLLMYLMRAQIVRLVLGTGEFGWIDTRLTAAALGVFSFGIFAAALAPILARVFFSLQDTKTPTAIGVLAVSLNILLSLIFVILLSIPNEIRDAISYFLRLGDIEDIRVMALPLALSFSVTIHFLFLMSFLIIKLGDIKLKEIWFSFQKILLASFFCGATAYLSLKTSGNFLNTQIFWGLFLQSGISATIGIAVYLFAATLFKSPEVKVFGQLFWHKLFQTP